MAKREGIMLAYPFDRKRLDKYTSPLIIQPKLNGDRCRAVIDAQVRDVLDQDGGAGLHAGGRRENDGQPEAGRPGDDPA